VSDAGTTASQTPGFGVGVVVVALVAFLAVGLRRRG
jgi:PGF-CTERM protein